MPACAKPYSAASDENKEAILAVIQPLFKDARRLLEIGSGTGQHAVYFSAAMPHLTWQASDLSDQLLGLRAWRDEAAHPNLPYPLALDVLGTWPVDSFDAVFSANTAHIMAVEAVVAMIRGIAAILAPGGYFALYGPFNEDGRYTSDSNRRFDAWLKSQDPRMGLRDLGDLQALADRHGLDFVLREPMPVNNLTLVWRRQAHRSGN